MIMGWRNVENNLTSLPPAQRKIAEYMLKNKLESIFLTALQLGKNAGSSEASVIRMASNLGFSSFPDFIKSLQEEAKDQLSTLGRLQTHKLQPQTGGLIARIINSDQGSQYTSNLYIERIRAESESISISMDGRGRCMDNIFTERFWRSYKQEEVYLKEYESPREARRSTAEYMKHYNFNRPHQSLNYRTPWEVYSGEKAKKVNIK